MLAATLLAVAATIVATAFRTRPAGAAFPGENGKIVYEDLDLNTFDYEVFAMNPDGTDKTQLTDEGAEDRMAAVSPDGTKIAFSSNRDGDQELYAMGASDGSGLARLTDGPTLGLDPDWQANTAPSVTAMRPAPRSKTRDLTSTKISAMVAEVQDDLAKSDARFYVDGRPRRSFMYSQATDRLVYESKELSPGKHTAKVVATDSSGAAGTKKWSFVAVERRR